MLFKIWFREHGHRRLLQDLYTYKVPRWVTCVSKSLIPGISREVQDSLKLEWEAKTLSKSTKLVTIIY